LPDATYPFVGANFDYESAVALNSSLRGEYAALVTETAAEFHRRIPGSQVSLDAAWGPYGVDGERSYSRECAMVLMYAGG